MVQSTHTDLELARYLAAYRCATDTWRECSMFLGISPEPKVKEGCEGRRGAYRSSVLAAFKNYDPLKAPTSPRIRAYIEYKLAEYKKRLLRQFAHPGLAPGFWDATFKVLVAEAVLGTVEEVNLADLYIAVVAHYGDQVEPVELLDAWCVIASYLGTPVPGLPITSDVKHR